MRHVRKCISAAVLLWSIGIGAQGPGRTRAENPVRSFRDSSTDIRWLLRRNVEHPGGPGRWTVGKNDDGEDANRRLPKSNPAKIIHAGDRVIVEETTAKISMRLEGFATASAVAGELISVRLKGSGWVVRAVIEGPGKARLAEESR